MFLALSILVSTIILVVFRIFKRFEINNLQAIIFNYFIAAGTGLLFHSPDLELNDPLQNPWFIGAMILGIFFIAGFYLAAVTTQKSGMSVTAVASKMSVIVPVSLGIVYFDEHAGIFKIIGIVTALVAVYLVSIKRKDGIHIEKQNLVYPLLVFLVGGIIDSALKFIETKYLQSNEIGTFSSFIFASAAVIGTFILAGQALFGKFKFQLKNLIGGLFLGVINYYSIYFLVKALRNDHFDSSTVFTINNVGIVALSTLAGILIFRETLIRKNWIGLVLAVISIILVANSN